MTGKPPNPWDRPNPLPTKGAASPEAIYMAVGYALSQWVGVEEMLLRVFSRMTGLDEYTTAHTYGNLPTSHSKIAMIRSAGDARFNKMPAEHKYMGKLLTLIVNFLARRNDIAHGHVVELNGEILLLPPLHISKSYNLNEDAWFSAWNYAFADSHILVYAGYFGNLMREVIVAETLLLGGLGLPPEHAETPLSQHLQPVKTALQSKPSPPTPPPPLSPSTV
jgi:hypothetical protein